MKIYQQVQQQLIVDCITVNLSINNLFYWLVKAKTCISKKIIKDAKKSHIDSSNSLIISNHASSSKIQTKLNDSGLACLGVVSQASLD